MKKLYTLLVCICIFEIAHTQVPQKLNYQAVARNSSGAVLASQPVSLRFTIHNLTTTGAEVYKETHSSVMTNQFGLFSVEIGGGSPESGDFSTINWGTGDKYLQVALDPANGISYTDMGTSQLLSVPYALYAGNGLAANGAAPGDMLYWDGTTWSLVPVGLPGQVMVLNSSNVPEWQNPPPPLQAPAVTINAVTSVSTTDATLNGTVNANNFNTTVVFEYGLTTAYGDQIAATPGFVAGTSLTGVSAALTGLLSGTTYHCRLAAINAVNISYSNDTTFTTMLADYTLFIIKDGGGSGNVTSTPAGISCGSTCSALYTQGTMVSLTAAAQSGSTFAGWSGSCSGTGACVVTMDVPRTVTATFVPTPYALTVTRDGLGSGTVTSIPAGIACGATCAAFFNHGTMVTLTATPAPGSVFSGWSGGCSGTGTCTVTITNATSVTATFD